MSGTSTSMTLDSKILKGLSSLIETCARNGVLKLEIEGIKVEFNPYAQIVPDSDLTGSHIPTENSDVSNLEPSDGALEEEKLELLKITDPAQYEEELLSQD